MLLYANIKTLYFRSKENIKNLHKIYNPFYKPIDYEYYR